jgi:hypothetical protein
MNGEIELIPWTKYETDTITFEFDASITPTIEARGIDASITFDATKGLTYDINLGGVVILKDVMDNGSLDENTTTDVITISGLTEGLSYDISFVGQIPDTSLTNITIESRSTNASISFTAFDGLTYEVKSGETMIKANLKDNQQGDLDEKEGVITIDGLTQGLPYDVYYEGYVVLETITQDEVDGQVDKLFVLYQYTFISFVPLYLNQRPTFKDLKLDYDGFALYDKKDYFSSSIRQSFVVDNDSGFIYKIENTNIESISKGILWLKNNFVPHDLRIKPDGDLEFYPIFTNASIIAFDAFKDKYGNKFILNNRLNQTFVESKTTFFVTEVNYNPKMESQLFKVVRSGFLNSTQLNVTGFVKGVTYWMTELNTTLMIERDTLNLWVDYNKTIKNIQLINHLHEKEDVALNLDIKVFDFEIYNHVAFLSYIKPSKISNGKVFFENLTNNRDFNWTDNSSENIDGRLNRPSFTYHGELGYYDLLLEKHINFRLASNSSNNLWNALYLSQYDILLEYTNGKIYVIKNVSEFMSETFEFFNSIYNERDWNWNPGSGGTHSSLIDSFNNINFIWAWSSFDLKSHVDLDYELLLDDVGFENGDLIRFGIDGNITYELILEDVDGRITVVPYVKGTYVAPPAATITFQPINR